MVRSIAYNLSNECIVTLAKSPMFHWWNKRFALFPESHNYIFLDSSYSSPPYKHSCFCHNWTEKVISFTKNCKKTILKYLRASSSTLGRCQTNSDCINKSAFCSDFGFCEQSGQVGDHHEGRKTKHVEETYTETEYTSDYESYPEYYEYYEDGDIDYNTYENSDFSKENIKNTGGNVKLKPDVNLEFNLRKPSSTTKVPLKFQESKPLTERFIAPILEDAPNMKTHDHTI